MLEFCQELLVHPHRPTAAFAWCPAYWNGPVLSLAGRWYLKINQCSWTPLLSRIQNPMGFFWADPWRAPSLLQGMELDRKGKKKWVLEYICAASVFYAQCQDGAQFIVTVYMKITLKMEKLKCSLLLWHKHSCHDRQEDPVQSFPSQ